MSPARPADQWDVPAVSEGYAGARDQIVAKVERLLSDLATRT
jgi:hypothetical protein